MKPMALQAGWLWIQVASSQCKRTQSALVFNSQVKSIYAKENLAGIRTRFDNFYFQVANLYTTYTSYECQSPAADKMYVDLQVSLLLLGRMVQHSLPSLVILHLTLCRTKPGLINLFKPALHILHWCYWIKTRSRKLIFKATLLKELAQHNLSLLSVEPY